MLYELFPTKIFKKSYTGDLIKLQNSIIPFLDPIFEESKTDNQVSMRNGGICSVNVCNNLQDRIDISELVNFVKSTVEEYWKELNYVEANIKIYHSWANVYPPGSYIDNHNHSPSPLTASFYLKKPQESGNIIFENPISTLLRYQPYKGLSDKDNYASAFDEVIEINEGDLVIFPGWIMHKTQPNRSAENRIILGFDVTYGK